MFGETFASDISNLQTSLQAVAVLASEAWLASQTWPEFAPVVRDGWQLATFP